jgi:hypothetical protein
MKKKSGLPKVWAIRQASSQQVCQWFRQHESTSNAKITGAFLYLVYYSTTNQTSYEDYLSGNMVEITVDQFNEHILKIKPGPVEPSYDIY